MKLRTKEGKGITLIALVITIIVLLILSGVTIATLTGENGILTQANKAKTETDEKGALEAVQLETAGSFDDQGSYSSSLAKANLEKNLNAVVTENSDRTLSVKYKGYDFLVDVNGEVVEDTLGARISATNYGDYIDYSVDLGIDGDRDGETTDIDDWRIFYKDESENVFIIAADYVPNTNTLLIDALGKAGMYGFSTYDSCWRNEVEYKAVDSNMASLFQFGYSSRSDYDTSISKTSMKAASRLLDMESWSAFATGVNGAIAIGGSTIEMYVASWNEKGYTPLYCNNSNSAGYYVGTTDKPLSTVSSMKTTSGYEDTLYYPHTSSYDNCDGYWLASPSGGNSYGNYVHVMNVNRDGDVSDNYYNSGSSSYYKYGVRPVVCLPSGIKGTKGQDGIWTIQE